MLNGVFRKGKKKRNFSKLKKGSTTAQAYAFVWWYQSYAFVWWPLLSRGYQFLISGQCKQARLLHILSRIVAGGFSGPRRNQTTSVVFIHERIFSPFSAPFFFGKKGILSKAQFLSNFQLNLVPFNTDSN